jgi:hypothetical protein
MLKVFVDVIRAHFNKYLQLLTNKNKQINKSSTTYKYNKSVLLKNIRCYL